MKIRNLAQKCMVIACCMIALQSQSVSAMGRFGNVLKNAKRAFSTTVENGSHSNKSNYNNSNTNANSTFNKKIAAAALAASGIGYGMHTLAEAEKNKEEVAIKEIKERVLALQQEEKNKEHEAEQLLQTVLKDSQQSYVRKTVGDFIQLVKLLFTFSDNESEGSYTKIHLEAFSGRFGLTHEQHALLMTYLTNDSLKSLLVQAYDLQKTYTQQGYTVFYHGQKAQFRLPERWHTKLFDFQRNVQHKDFIFAHVNKKPLHVLSEDLREEEAIRNNMLSGKEGHYDKVLFMNVALFSNLHDFGNCTAHYVVANQNITSPNISLKTVFSLHNHADIYQEFAQELESLEKEYLQLSRFGTLLVVAVPNSILEECTYLTDHNGRRIKDDANRGMMSMAETLDGYKKDIYEVVGKDLFYCLIMDTKYGLNPDSGIKIHDIASIPANELAVFNAKEEALWLRIQKRIQHKNNPEKQYKQMIKKYAVPTMNSFN